MPTLIELEMEIRRRGMAPQCGGGGAIQQDPRELAEFAQILIDEKIETYLEVGLGAGETFRFLTEFVGLKGRGIDQHYPKSLAADDPRIFLGNCYDTPARRWAKENGPYDLVFIDALHQTLAVLQDARDYGGLATRLVAFHDVGSRFGSQGPKLVWDAIAAISPERSKTILSDNPDTQAGIGILWVGKCTTLNNP